MTVKAKAIFELDAELRDGQGKGASRRLRRLEDRVPAIMYGGDKAPTPISLDQKKVMHALENQAFYSHILTLNFGGKKEKAVVKDIQRHHFKKAIMHMDFLRINAKDRIDMRIPLHFTGEATCPGVKKGGLVNHRLIDVEVRCLASDLPERIEVDLSQLELDQAIHLSDLKLPKGVEIVSLIHGRGPEHDHAVVIIHMPRGGSEDETPVAAAPAATEVIPKGKEATAPAAAAPSKEKGKGK